MRAAAALALILALGGAWRGLEAAARWHEPLSFGDEYQYFAMGVGWRQGELLAETGRTWRPTARRAPLWPALLSFSAGSPPRTGPSRGLGAALAALTILLAYAIASRLHSPLAGLSAAGLTAANAALARAAPTLFIETAYGFLVLCAAAALAECVRAPDPRRAAGLGFACGASLLCRSNLVAVAPAAAAWLWRAGRRRAAAWVLAAAALILLPWAARNARWFGRFIPLDDRTVTPLAYLASAGAVRAAPHLAFTIERTPLLDAQQPELAEADDVESLYDAMAALTRRNLREHPGVFLKAWLVRTAVAVSSFIRAISWPCAGLVMVGAAILAGPWRALYGLLAYFFALYTLVAFQDRYLLPVVPLGLVLAGAALAEAASLLGGVAAGPSEGRLESAALGLSGCAAALMTLAAFARLAGELGTPRALVARAWADGGWAALRADSAVEAKAAFERAVLAVPDWPEPYLGRAVARARLGDESAVADANEAIRRSRRPWTSYLDDATAAWAAAAFEARAGRLETRGRRRAAARDLDLASRLRTPGAR